MKVRAGVVLLVLLSSACGKSSEPILTEFSRFKIVPALRKAAQLQAMGRDEACKSLLSGGGGVEVFVLCRMLFVRRGTSEFRRPHIGAAEFLANTDYPD